LRVERRSSVSVQINRPDTTLSTLTLDEVEPSVFIGSFKAGFSGIYNCGLLAKGATLRGNPFTREQTLHGSVFNGGDRQGSLVPPASGDLCSLLR
jgi:hypothetical protein